ncbi:MAG: phosphodiester glycosidase family protein [Rhodobacteraceae bacterium]|nr:phosphodiester glycosidase family protein [Paracoccaceae bacterium]
MTPAARHLAAALAALLPAQAAADCTHRVHEGRGYVVCEARAGDDLRLFLTAPDGRPFGSFERIDAALAAEGLRLDFAMNAGMYHPDRRPVGLYREPAGDSGALVTSAGPGNFGMLPNGVFCISAGRFAVIESRRFAAAAPECRYATQSGPMLVIDGALHPRFLPDSTSRHVRNGVGVAAGGQTAFFAISDRPVTFHQFARFFRDVLGTPDALYLDGRISRLHAPALGRSDPGLPMGPVVGRVVAAADAPPG